MRGFQTEPADHRFFAGMAVLVTVIVAIGFSQTYPAKVLDPGSKVPLLIHLHALVFAGWLLLFVGQTALALRGRLDLHRTVGAIGMALAALMLALGAAASVTVARLGHRGIPGVEFADPGGFLLLNLAALAAFSILAGAAWLLRDRPQAHKRLMLMACVGALAPPGIARLPFVSGHAPAIAIVALVLLLAGPVYDLLTRRRLHPAYVFGLLVALAAVPPIVAQAAASGPWRSVAAWLTG